MAVSIHPREFQPPESNINHLLDACCRICNGDDCVVMVTLVVLTRGGSLSAWLFWVSGLFTSCEVLPGRALEQLPSCEA